MSQQNGFLSAEHKDKSGLISHELYDCHNVMLVFKHFAFILQYFIYMI